MMDVHVLLKKCQIILVKIALRKEAKNSMANMDVEKLKEKLNLAFNNKVPIEILHGKLKNVEKDKIMNNFKEGITKILISTTVIEVGVDVKNATCIVIFNAERFGLSQLHQLRGRVGRGRYQSYCILKSDDAEDNARLEAMVRTNNGFEIAEADLQNRGAGDIIGTKQTGNDKYVEMALKYPKMFESIKKIAGNMVLDGSYMKLWEQKQQFSEKAED